MIPHRLFSLYIAVQILKNIIGKGLAFLGIQSYNIAKSSEYFVFFSLHFNARAFGALGHASLFFSFYLDLKNDHNKRPQLCLDYLDLRAYRAKFSRVFLHKSTRKRAL